MARDLPTVLGLLFFFGALALAAYANSPTYVINNYYTSDGIKEDAPAPEPSTTFCQGAQCYETPPAVEEKHE